MAKPKKKKESEFIDESLLESDESQKAKQESEPVADPKPGQDEIKNHAKFAKFKKGVK